MPRSCSLSLVLLCVLTVASGCPDQGNQGPPADLLPPPTARGTGQGQSAAPPADQTTVTPGRDTGEPSVPPSSGDQPAAAAADADVPKPTPPAPPPATASAMLYPVSVAAAADGRLFVADQDLPGVWKVSEGKAEVFFQAEKKNRTPLNALRCVGWDHEAKLLAGDAATMDIYRFGEEPKPEPLTSGGIRTPVDLAVGSDGTIYVADADNAVIWRMPTAGGKPERFVELRGPRGLAMVDGTLWAASLGEHQLVRISADGKVTPAVEGRPFSFPNDVALDTNGTAYVSDGYAKTIWKVDSSGKATKWASGEPLIGPVGLAWRGETLLAADPKARNVFEISADGKPTTMVTPSVAAP